MKLTLKDLGNVQDTEIELDGITVLCGYNGTGKSAICRKVLETADRAECVTVGQLDNILLFGGETLVIECPENSAHPVLQLELADKILQTCANRGVRVLMTTYSTLMLRAIEFFSGKYDLETRCHYYKTEPVEGMKKLFRVRNVDGQTNLIYHEFYMPYEEV